MSLTTKHTFALSHVCLSTKETFALLRSTGKLSGRVLLVLFLFLSEHVFSQNPIAGNQSFQILTEGNFTSTNLHHIHGPLAVGGNLIVNNPSTISEVNMDNTGSYVFTGDGSTPTGLLVKGAITWTTGALKVLDGNYIHIGNSTGSITSNNGGTGLTQVLPTATSYNNAKRIEATLNQPTNVFQTVGFDFTTLFNTYRSTSTTLSTKTNNVQLFNSSNVAIAGNNVSSAQNVRINTLSTGVNYLNLTSTSLNNIGELLFDVNAIPSVSKVLVINVPISANFVWNNVNMPGLSGQHGPYVIWNFYGGTTYNLTINTGSMIVGTVFAPNMNLIKTGIGDIEGGLIAKTMQLGAGEIHNYQFASDLVNFTTCDCAGNLLTNPGFETSDFTGWTLATNDAGHTSFAGDNSVAVCGNRYAYFNPTAGNATDYVSYYQNVTATAGQVFNFSIYAGVHDASKDHQLRLQFFNSSNVLLAGGEIQQVDNLAGSGLIKYILTGTAPTGTAYVRVTAYASGAWSGTSVALKIDAACLTTTATSTCTNTNASLENGTFSSFTTTNANINGTLTTYGGSQAVFLSADPGGATIADKPITGFSANTGYWVDATTNGGLGAKDANRLFVIPSGTGANKCVFPNSGMGFAYTNNNCYRVCVWVAQFNPSSPNNASLTTQYNFEYDDAWGTTDPGATSNYSITPTSISESGASNVISWTLPASTNVKTTTGAVYTGAAGQVVDWKTLNWQQICFNFTPAIDASRLTIYNSTASTNNGLAVDGFCIASSCTACSNVTAGGTVGSNQTFCVSGNPTAFTSSVAASGGSGTISYQWEKSVDGGTTWVDIIGATSATYDEPNTIAITTHYRRKAMSSTCTTFGATSNTIIVTVVSSNSATASSNSPINVGGTINLTSTGGGTYTWSGPSSFASTLQNPSRTSATTAMAGVYTVTVTNSGCAATATTNVVVNSSFSCSGSCETQNLVVNPQFEIDMSGWTASNGQLTRGGGGTYGSFLEVNVGDLTGTYAAYQDVTFGANAPYKFTAYAAKHALNNLPRMYLEFFNGTTFLSKTADILVTKDYDGTFQTINFEGNTPANTTKIRIVGWTQNNALKFDNVSLIGCQACFSIVPPASICVGQSATLTANNCSGTVTWNTGATGSTIIVNPTTTTTYTATCNNTTNVLSNPSFETGDLTAWNNWNYTTITSTASERYSGTYGAKVTASSAGGGFAQDNVAVAGESYTMKVWGKVSSATPWSGVGVRFLNSSWTSLADVSTEVNATSFQEYSGTITAPAGTAWVQAYAWTDASTILYLDNFSLVKTSANTSSTATVTVNTAPTATATGDTECVGATITLASTGGGTYSWTGPASFASTLQNPTRVSATAAMAGVYTVTVTAANGCTATATANVIVNTGTVPTATVVNTGCTGATGSITVTNLPDGYSTNINGGAWTQYKNSYVDLAAGTYAIGYQGGGCNTYANFTVATSTDNPLLSLAKTDPTCSTTGSVTVTGSGGTTGLGDATYQLWYGISGSLVSNLTSNANYPNTPSLSTLVGIAEGYENSMDNIGGRLSGYIVAPTTGTYYFWVASDDYSEFWGSGDSNPANKALLASVSGYTGYREWNKYPSQKTAAISLNAGQMYYFEVLYKEGTGGDNISLGWSKPGEATTVPSEVIPGKYLRPNVASSTTTPVYQYKIGGGAFQTGNVFTGLAAGTYTVTIQDAGGCTATNSITLTSPGSVTTPTSTGASRCGTGTVTLSASGCTGGTYNWFNVASGGSSLATTATYTTPSISTTTNYYVSCTVGSCESARVLTVATVNASTAITASSNSPVCIGSAINLNVTAGTSYSWTGPSAFTANSQAPSVVATAARGGVYSVTVTSANGCTSTATTNVVIPAISISNIVVSSCINQPLQDVATVSMSIAWTNAQSGDKIKVSINNKTEYIDVAAGVTSPQTVTFIVPANGISNIPILASWVTFGGGNCTTLASFNAPVACSTDNLNCEKILYLCGPDKPADGDAWDHGFMNYLAGQGANITATYTKPDASGYGLYNPSNTSVLMSINLNDYTTIIVSPTTEANVASNLLTAMKAYAGGVLMMNYTEADDLGLTVGNAGYNWQDYAYTNNTNNVKIYNYDNINPTAGNVITGGNYQTTADSYLWAGANNMSSAINSLYWYYTPSDVITGVPSTHGARVYLGYHMNGLYANAQNGGYMPAPSTSYFSPTNHLTLEGKAYFDQAIKNVTTGVQVLATGDTKCAGATLSLSSSGVGISTYSWSGPNSFTSTLQNPTRANATAAMAGIYTVTVTSSTGCTATATANVVVNTPTAPTSAGGSRCGTGTVTMNASGCAGGTISWYGALTGGTALTTGTTYTTPSISATTTYYIECSLNGCISLTRNSAVATINAIPVASATGDTECVGSTISLLSSGGSTYSWSGPSSFTSTLQNPTRSGATTAMAGVYTVTVTSAAGCSATATANVVVNTIPTAPTSAGASRCGPGTVTLSASGCAGGTISWYGALTGGTALTTGATYTTPSIASTTTYYIECSLNGCVSTTRNSSVATVNTVPTAAISGAANLNCSVSSVNRTATGGGTYLWSNSLGTNASVTITTAGVYTVTVTSATGCTATATTSVTLNTTIPNAGPDQNLSCGTSTTVRSTSPLIANLPGGTWSSPTSTSILYFQSNNDTTYAFITAKGVYPIVYTLNGCSDTLKVTFQDAAPSCNNLWDNLTLPLSVGVSTINTPVYGTILNASAIGGETDVSNTLLAGGASGNSADISSGAISWNNGPGDFTKTVFSWDGIDNSAAVLNPTGLGGMNFSGAGNFGFIINSVDVARFKITLRLYTNASNISESYFTRDIAGNVNSNIPVEFTTFTTIAGTGANLSNIGAVELILEPKNLLNESNGIDFNATCFHTPCLICPTPVASGNGTCVGGTINLTASGGNKYSWTGPNGFTSTLQNPSRTNATTAMSGYYVVTITSNGCTATANTYIQVSSISASVSNVSCNNNGTLSTSTDDYFTFLLTPSGSLGGRFTISATQAGSPIALTLSNGNPTGSLSYAYPTPLRVPNGKAGLGNVTLTLTDVQNPSCTYSLVVTDSGTCNAANCTGTTQTVSYSYRIPLSSTELTQVPINLPKFDNAAGTKILTKVDLKYGMNEVTTAYVENQAASSSAIDIAITGSESIKLGATTLKSFPINYSTSTTLPAQIVVAAQGNYAGDSAYVVLGSTKYSTLYRMNSWLSNVTDDIYSNPKTDARWVTNATGNATHDDDIYIMPVQTFSFYDSTTYTTPTDLTQFIGTGNIGLTATTDNNANFTGDGGNVIYLQRTKAYAYATVTYTYVCCIPPTATSASSNSAICSGQTINLTASSTGGSSYSWTGPNGFTSTLQNPTITGATTVRSGIYTVTIVGVGTCTATATTNVVVNAIPTAPTSAGGSRCGTGTVTMTASGCAGGTISWYGALTGGTALTTGATYTTPSISATTTYYLECSLNGCISTSRNSAVATINAIPVASATGDTECVGSTISLLSSGGSTYSWSGPSSFTSTLQNPTRSGATTAMAGVYTVTVTSTAGCSATATTNVVVNVIPSSPTSAGGSRCGTGTVTMTASGCAGGTISWYGALTGGTALTTGATYTTPSISATTTYYLECSLNGCISPTRNSAVATINAIPVASATGDTECVGSTISLLSSGGSTYSWSGPSSFTSTLQNPTRSGATTAMAGVYTVTVTSGAGCSATATTNVVVNVIPTAPTSAGGSRCGTGTVTMTASGCAGGTISWYGALTGGTALTTGATYTTPSISATTTYYLECSLNGCISTTRNSAVATVNAIPVASATGDTECVGSTLSLLSSGGSTYSWSGPSSFTSTLQNPTRSGATTAMAGVYTVTVTSTAGCSATATTNVVVNVIPSSPTSAGGSRCGTGTVTMSASGCAGGTISWYGALTGGTALSTGTTYTTPSLSSTTTYYVECSLNGCISSTRNSAIATINSIPTATATANSPIIGGTLNLYATGGTTYLWTGPNGFTSILKDVSTAPVTALMAGVYSVTVSVNGCTATATTNVSLLTTDPGDINCSLIPTLSFTSPTLITGTAGAVNAQYRFSNVTGGTDAIVTIMSKSHPDIEIIDIDIPATTYGGYEAAMQPIIDYNWINVAGSYDAAGEKSVTFKIDFVETGTSTPKVMPNFIASGIDIDGSVEVREFIESSGHQSHEIQTPTSLTLSGGLKAKGAYASYTGINELALDAVISYGYVGKSSITITYGAEWNGNSSDFVDNVNPTLSDERRLNSLYFKCYDLNTTVCDLPLTAPTGVPASRCGTGTVTLSATGCSGTYIWYATVTGGTAIGTSSSYITPSISVNTTYYVECNAVGCTSTRTSVLATVNAIPIAPTVSSNSICGAGSITLTATGCVGGTVSWFTSKTGGTSLGTGTTYTASALTSSAVYFAACTSSSGCVSTTRNYGVATINSIPEATLTGVGSLCLGYQSTNSGKLILTKFKSTDTFSYNIGSSYNSGTASAFAAIPANGEVLTGIADPSTSITYTVRIKNAENCIIDRVVTLTNQCSTCPAGYCEPSTVVKTK